MKTELDYDQVSQVWLESKIRHGLKTFSAKNQRQVSAKAIGGRQQ